MSTSCKSDNISALVSLLKKKGGDNKDNKIYSILLIIELLK